MIAGMYTGFFFSGRGRVSQMQDLLVKNILAECLANWSILINGVNMS